VLAQKHLSGIRVPLCVYMYVCMYVCIYVCVPVCVYVSEYLTDLGNVARNGTRVRRCARCVRERVVRVLHGIHASDLAPLSSSISTFGPSAPRSASLSTILFKRTPSLVNDLNPPSPRDLTKARSMRECSFHGNEGTTRDQLARGKERLSRTAV